MSRIAQSVNEQRGVPVLLGGGRPGQSVSPDLQRRSGNLVVVSMR